jgi:hypothetical protein
MYAVAAVAYSNTYPGEILLLGWPAPFFGQSSKNHREMIYATPGTLGINVQALS